jgi:two-component system cell cycle response regulator
MQKILIADDSIVSRHLLEATLKKWGYDVLVACDGAEAWRILEREDAPALAILDWVMPQLTGPEVCTRLRANAREKYTYILLLTSKGQKEDLIAGMSAGADDYIIKPFDQQELQVRLEAGKRILKLHNELIEAKRKLFRQATYDELTGLYNRARILENLRTELHRAEREHTPVGMVLADLDRFKSINDTYGHSIGDAVLREAARRMEGSIRSYDSIGRYGGEEFLLVLPGCDLGCAALQAERLRLAICEQPMALTEAGDRDETQPLSLPISASLGATTFYPGTPTSVDSLIKLADDALYEAKRMGRNRVVMRHDAAAPVSPATVDCDLAVLAT